MGEGLDLLAGTALSIGVVHTLVGVDHSLPFVALARARRWSWARLVTVTALCGAGHVLSSVAIGSIGIGMGVALDALVWVEGLRGHLAAYLTIGLGLAYAAHALWKHRAHGRHAASRLAGQDPSAWWLFIVFVLGPCEALIPMLMVPAASHHWAGVAFVCTTFGVATVLTMLVTVSVGYLGVERIRLRALERYADVWAGIAIAGCGAAIELLGI